LYDIIRLKSGETVILPMPLSPGKRRPVMRGATFLICMLAFVSAYASGRTWYVLPDSSGDAPTIQAAIDSAEAGDEVLVSTGVWTEAVQSHTFGPSMLIMRPGITLRGEGAAYSTTLDAQSAGRVILCPMLAQAVTIDNFTIRGGAAAGAAPEGSGGGVLLRGAGARIRNCEFVDNEGTMGAGLSIYSNPDSTQVVDCSFYDNTASEGGGGVYIYDPAVRFNRCRFVNNAAGSSGGGAVYCYYSSPAVIFCEFLNNSAPGSGGAIRCYEASPYITYSTLFYNNAVSGALTLHSNSAPQLSSTIVAGDAIGPGISCADGSCNPVLLCCDIYGNAGGDWTGCIADQFGVDGNFSADPLFCDVMSGDLTVEDCSPCLPGNNPLGAPCGCGSRGIGCACGEATKATTWGAIKSLYR
jgi:predicted outer membrane repeat protein